MGNLNKSKKSNHDDGYFDDCPICQAKKMGIKMERYSDDTGSDGVWEEGFSAAKINPKDLEELKKAFQKAKNQGALVGGEWFEGKDDQKQNSNHPSK